MQRIGSSTASRSAFIADLHLTPDEPATVKLAADFIAKIAAGVEQLFILGDLVEYWVGDDAYAGELDEFFVALARISQAGNAACTTYLMHGNRDFLIGEQFTKANNIHLMPADGYVLDTGLNGSDLLLMHGDTLCTDDQEYQAMRQVLRSSEWQQDFLSLSVTERHSRAQLLRDQSKEATAKKSNEICDVNQPAVEETITKAGVSRLLHGHTHRPARHEYQDEQQPDQLLERWVLGDWQPDGAIYALLDAGTLSLRQWPGNDLLA